MSQAKPRNGASSQGAGLPTYVASHVVWLALRTYAGSASLRVMPSNPLATSLKAQDFAAVRRDRPGPLTWFLILVLVGFAVGMPLLEDAWTPQRIAVYAVVCGVPFLFALFLISPSRLEWCGRLAAFGVFVAFLWRRLSPVAGA